MYSLVTATMLPHVLPILATLVVVLLLSSMRILLVLSCIRILLVLLSLATMATILLVLAMSLSTALSTAPSPENAVIEVHPVSKLQFRVQPLLQSLHEQLDVRLLVSYLGEIQARVKQTQQGNAKGKLTVDAIEVQRDKNDNHGDGDAAHKAWCDVLVEI